MSLGWGDDKVREGELTAEDFRLIKNGHWYLLTLNGMVIKRRLSRMKIVGAEVWFSTGRSPRHDRTKLDMYPGRTQWIAEGVKPTRPDNHSNNLIYVPLET